MDPEYVLKWVVGALSLFECCRPWLRFPIRGFSWRGLALTLLLLLAADHWLRIPGAAYALVVVWCLLVAAPTLALERRQRALHSGRPSRARFWAHLFAWLHPFAEPRATARWLSARALAAEGKLSDAEQLLHALEKHPSLGELARLEGLLLAARWSSLVDRLEENAPEHPGARDIALQAFGETGRIERMLHAYRALEPELEAPGLPHLEVAAYLGSLATFELALEQVPAQPPEVVAYFRGIALQAAGERLAARSSLQEAEAHPAYQRRALARLRRPLEPVSSLAGKLRARAATGEQVLRFALERLSTPPKRCWVTWGLAAVLVGMFLRSVPGGAHDADNLIRMGALILPQDQAPGAWRMLTTGLLHKGFAHLALNLLLILLFGSVLERLWGALPLLACFSCANVGSYWIATWLSTATPDRPELLLGASAGAYGIVGALIAFDAVGFAFERSRALLRRISVLALAILTQMVFDAFTPSVRSWLHWTGAGLGALVACPFAFRFWMLHAPERASPPSQI